ncbi:MAG TPA: nuclear transport factor 2 family protein [Acidimicrobiales bacterium]|jgi:limonene-1,2-epoxide hydrolase|nr:nuclear transport factor 2 family protein [Acidimicrobiales bacterium]
MVVEEYLAAVVAHDWDALRRCLREDVVRNGPFRDEYRGRDDYVAFLAELMPTLPGYSMDVTRVTYSDDGRLAFAELAETVDVGGSPLRTEESLVFELDADERIEHIDIYIKTNAERPPRSLSPQGLGGEVSEET